MKAMLSWTAFGHLAMLIFSKMIFSLYVTPGVWGIKGGRHRGSILLGKCPLVYTPKGPLGQSEALFDLKQPLRRQGLRERNNQP